MSLKVESESVQWSLVGIFAAVQVVATIIPYSIAIGTEGNISVGLLTAPLIGILLGPYFGAVTVAIGSILGIMIYPASGIMGMFTPLATISGAIAAGLIRRGRGHYVAPIYIIGIIAFLVSPIGNVSWLYLWFHFLTLILVVILTIPSTSVFFKNTFDFEVRTWKQIVIVAITCFIAVMTDHIIGSAIAAYYFIVAYSMSVEALAAIFQGIVFVYPLERLVATAILTVVVVGISKAIPQNILVSNIEKRGLDN